MFNCHGNVALRWSSVRSVRVRLCAGLDRSVWKVKKLLMWNNPCKKKGTVIDRSINHPTWISIEAQ